MEGGQQVRLCFNKLLWALAPAFYRPRASIKFKRQQGFTSKYLKAGNLSEKSRAATSVTTAATSVCLV
eukprot:scaffold195463_cov16-Tisochrysis_lutea.AAC.1